MLIFILLLPIIFFIAAFLVNAAMFRPEKRPEANIDGRRGDIPQRQKSPCRVSLE